VPDPNGASGTNGASLRNLTVDWSSSPKGKPSIAQGWPPCGLPWVGITLREEGTLKGFLPSEDLGSVPPK
jgi:hypothetical protein